MRTNNVTLLAIAATTLSTAACKWTDFDDLEHDMWVESTEKPSDHEIQAFGRRWSVSGVK